MPAFNAGEPAMMDIAVLCPPAELAGLTEDGVTRVQVVVNGTAQDAVFGNDAWYYRFPDDKTSAAAATELRVTMEDGSTVTVPTRIVDPSSIGGGCSAPPSSSGSPSQ
jgi:hypothetical protein